MRISNYILNDIPIQSINEKVGVLKEMFNELTFSHLPVKKDQHYIGSIAENDIRCFDKDKTLADYHYALDAFFIKDDDQYLDILKAFAIHNTNILPVLEHQSNVYLGYLELNDFMSILDATPFIREEGNIIVVEKGHNDFSFSQVSQIVESNEGRLYGIYTSEMDNDKVQVTLKTGLEKMNEILQTFRRYGYKIVSEHQEDDYLQNLKERSDYLNKYLNI